MLHFKPILLSPNERCINFGSKSEMKFDQKGRRLPSKRWSGNPRRLNPD